MQQQLQQAFLLHSRPYRENSMLVNLLTEDEGKVAAVVYSGKTAKSNKKAILQPFLPLQVSLKGKSGLKNLSLVEASGKSFSLADNYLYSSFYLNELLVRLLPENIACTDLFHFYRSCLFDFAKQSKLEANLRQFELSLLDELGVGIDFTPAFESNGDDCVFIQEQGLVPVGQVEHGLESQMRYPCEQLQALAQGQLESAQTLRVAKALLRQVLHYYLGDKPLNSRKLFIKRKR